MFRMYASPDGETHFAPLEMSYEAVSQLIARASGLEATSVTFNHVKAGTFNDWHSVRRRQFVVGLSGESSCEVSDGETRIVGPGTVMLAEDLSGKGHVIRVPRTADVYFMAVGLEDQTPTS